MRTAALPAPAPLLRPDLPLWLVIAMACLASFMVVMDGSIVNVALPAMQRDLQLSHEAQQWVIDAYLLSFGGCMLLAARAGDLYGRRPVLLAGLFLFTLASLAGGLASGATLLLAARAVQGIGAAVLATSSMTLVMAATHHDKQARASALSLWAALNSAGFALGVVIGGLLTEGAGWRWVMFVNVPVGLLLMAGIASSLLAPPAQTARPRLDAPGAVASMLGSALLVYGITQSTALGWNSPVVLGALALALGLFLLFIAIERRSASPLVRLSIFQLPGLAAGNLLMLGLGALLAASIYLISTSLQQVAGYGARETGLAMLPMGLMLAAVRLLFTKAMGAGTARHLPLWGALLAAAGLAWLGLLPARAAFVQDVLGPTLLVGSGLGMLILAATHVVTSGVPVQDAGLASGLANTARQLGGALGMATLATLAAAVAHAQPAGIDAQGALLAGSHAAFFAAAGLSLLCGLVSLRLGPPA
ncbi:MFS transporter [Variovorax arabinosiphilus]|uniref:MFS transporter n=1 Tax=Variovorax arabinosiphilus TaxID=3053498 RepID=UPI00257668D1|nr:MULTISPECIES: MFS transporter [unclassified Variovorax]MDM0119186.1 MFS transporter [Variovorax sp. J2L1-78]MDM0129612.1 MFS transporter [Variovorax sp. J2L1-63]MDM0232602.1 MFS transporter [Variovorax sp. J2R1-6]